MANIDNSNLTETHTRIVWEYEYRYTDGELVWFEAEDEDTASQLAVRLQSTERVRSRVETTTVTTTPWEVKEQTLIP